jgi:flagellin-like protein
MSNKKGLSPLVATILLVVFALVIGTATMSWGNKYVKNNSDNLIDDTGPIVIVKGKISNDPLKILQLSYITGNISLEQYLSMETEAVNSLKAKEGTK